MKLRILLLAISLGLLVSVLFAKPESVHAACTPTRTSWSVQTFGPDLVQETQQGGANGSPHAVSVVAGMQRTGWGVWQDNRGNTLKLNVAYGVTGPSAGSLVSCDYSISIYQSGAFDSPSGAITSATNSVSADLSFSGSSSSGACCGGSVGISVGLNATRLPTGGSSGGGGGGSATSALQLAVVTGCSGPNTMFQLNWNQPSIGSFFRVKQVNGSVTVPNLPDTSVISPDIPFGQTSFTVGPAQAGWIGSWQVDQWFNGGVNRQYRSNVVTASSRTDCSGGSGGSGSSPSVTLTPDTYVFCLNDNLNHVGANVHWSFTGNPGTLTISNSLVTRGGALQALSSDTAQPSQNSFGLSNLDINSTYEVRIFFASGSSNTIRFNTPNCTPRPSPPPPVQLTGSSICVGTQIQNKISWTNSSGAALYNVYRDGYFLLASPAGILSMNDVAVVSGTNYTYWVSAFSAGGISALATIVVTAKDCASPPPSSPPIPPVISGLASCSVSNQSQNVISWTPLVGSGYTYLVFRDGQSTGSSGGVTFSDVSGISSGIQYTYTLKVSNSAGVSGFSNPVVLTTRDCTPIPPPSLGITVQVFGQKTGLKRNSTYDYTVKVFDKATGNPILSGVTVTWSLVNFPNAFIGGQPSPTSNIGARLNTSSTCGHLQNTLIATAHLGLSGPSASDQPLLSFDDGCFLQILGDIFGKGLVQGLNVGSNAVVSSGGTIGVIRDGRDQSTFDIPNYSFKGNRLDWSGVQIDVRKSDGTIARLLKENAKVPQIACFSQQAQTSAPALPKCEISSNSSFNLNPKTPGDFRDQALSTANPEGGVWHVAGDLVINGPVQFIGSGTIIVDGKVTVNGSLKSTGLLGIISLYDDKAGDAICDQAKPAVVSLDGSQVGGGEINGAFFAPFGAINFGSGLSVANGLFAGKCVSVQNTMPDFVVSYDGRITKTPPPGFRQSFVPTLIETAP